MPPRPWLLAPMPGTPDSAELSATLGLGPIEFPEYLNRRAIVERVGPTELRENDFEIWGESLRTNFRDTLASNLALLVPGLAVAQFPWSGLSRVDYRLTMAVSRFEHDIPSGAIVLEVGWTLHRASETRSLMRKRQLFREPVEGKGFEAITTAMSRTLATLSREIATSLSTLPELGS